MMKLTGKCVLMAAIAITGVSLATPTIAADKAKAPPPPAKCTLHSHNYSCAKGICNVSWCGHDGKWYPTPFFCLEPFCQYKK